MKKLKQQFAYAIIWRDEVKKYYGINSYRSVICEYPFIGQDLDDDYNVLCIFETRKLANEFFQKNKDWKIIKIKLTIPERDNIK